MMKSLKQAKEPAIDLHLFQKTKRELVPNFNNIDQQVRKEINDVLTLVLTHQTQISTTTTNKNIAAKTKKQKIQAVSKLSFLEEAPLLRSHIWKLLLDTLELDPSTWHAAKQRNRELYHALKNKFLNSYIDEEDLLDLGFNNNFDRDLWDEIALDTKRTHSCLNFFQAEVVSPVFGKIYASKPTKHCDMLNRILYIWGKTNPTVRYVQGMNQILAPLYYLEFQSLDEISWDRESQVFFMFSSMMSFVIDMHIKEMDDCQSGIMGRMISLNHFLRVYDGELWQKMEDEGIFPQYYSFRWLALLLAQQFGLYDTMKLWDIVLAYDGYRRFFYVFCLCLAILKIRKKQIMQNDFITSLPLIQKLKDVCVEKVIKLGNQIYVEYKKKNIEKEYNRVMDESAKEKIKHEQIQNEAKAAHWSYADLVRNTGNYLAKWKNWGRKQ